MHSLETLTPLTHSMRSWLCLRKWGIVQINANTHANTCLYKLSRRQTLIRNYCSYADLSYTKIYKKFEILSVLESRFGD